MDKLNDFRSSNFSLGNKKFHERVNPYDGLSENDLENSIVLICEIKDAIVAYVQGSIHRRKNHKLSKLGYIDEIYVNEDVRSRGVANSL